MTPQQIKRALRLYKRFKTESAEYKAIARELGIDVGYMAFNDRCKELCLLIPNSDYYGVLFSIVASTLAQVS